MPRPAPTLKQRKVFALIRIFGGLVAALYLASVLIANLATGQAFDRTLMFTTLMAVAGFAYAAWYLRELKAVAREEEAQGGGGRGDA